MDSALINGRDFYAELKFSASRSSGPGGQNVNKLSTKIELRFNVTESTLLTEEEKGIILGKLGNRINKEGELVLTSQAKRSQLANKENVMEKFCALIINTLTPKKKRTPTKPSLQAKEKRLESKRILSQKKTLRRGYDHQ